MLNTLRITCFSSKSATVSHTNDVIFCDGQVQAFSLRIKKTDISNVTINYSTFQCQIISSAKNIQALAFLKNILLINVTLRLAFTSFCIVQLNRGGFSL